MELSNYQKYRGKCKEFCEDLVVKDPSLKLVRGHYYCPIWNKDEPHWWCTNSVGEIVDPTAKQFPSNGHGIYEEFDGFTNCEECGKRINESDMMLQGRYPVCSTKCACRLVGV